jgi:hypothetical protein
LGASSIEAVGDGSVTAEISDEFAGDTEEKCIMRFSLNGEEASGTTITVEVKDGDSLDLEVWAEREAFSDNRECNVCETERSCSAEGAEQASLWMRKSSKEKKTIMINKVELIKRIKLAANRISKRKRGLN